MRHLATCAARLHVSCIMRLESKTPLGFCGIRRGFVMDVGGAGGADYRPGGLCGRAWSFSSGSDGKAAGLSSGLIIQAVNIISLSCADGEAARLTSGLIIQAVNNILLSCADGAGRGLHGRPLPEVPPPKEKERTGPFLLLWTPSSFPQRAVCRAFGIVQGDIWPVAARRLTWFFRAVRRFSPTDTNLMQDLCRRTRTSRDRYCCQLTVRGNRKKQIDNKGSSIPRSSSMNEIAQRITPFNTIEA